MAPFVLNIKALGLSIENKPPPFLISTLGQLEQLSREFCHRSPAHFALNISEWRLEGEWLLFQMEVLSAHRARCRDVGQKLTWSHHRACPLRARSGHSAPGHAG